MSLWEKWEREKLKEMGMEAERRGGDVKIYDTRTKPNVLRQVWIVMITVAACLALVYAAMVVEALATGRRWSDTYVVRLLVERNAQRMRMAEGQR